MNLKLFTLTFLLLAQTAAAQTGFDNLPIPTETVIDNTPDSIAKALTSRPAPGTTRKPGQPVLFLIGNSTMRNGTRGNGSNGQWGWGYYATQYFDKRRIAVENQALGGMSTRTFYTDLWPAIRDSLQKDDWVIISIGHNDNSDYFDPQRARGVIPGIAPDTMITGFNLRTQQPDTVFSYGHYIRRYVADTRARGAHPILMSLTPVMNVHSESKNQNHNAGNKTPLLGEGGVGGGSETIQNAEFRTLQDPHSQWLAQLSQELDVPYVDLNELSVSELESFSPWKARYHYFGDKIHTSKFGAELNARNAAQGLLACQHPELQELKKMMNCNSLSKQDIHLHSFTPTPPDSLESPASSQTPKKKTIFITGDSTVKNADSDPQGMWGWGALAAEIFDTTRVNIVNAAIAGRSTRSYLREGRWQHIYQTLQPGDYVLIQFGHNDICPINDSKARGVIPSAQDTCHVYQLPDSTFEVVYSFGWYLRKIIDDTRERHAIPILVSLTPRNEWPQGHIERRNQSYGRWYQEVVQATGVEFLDLHNRAADTLDRQFAAKRLPRNPQKAQARIQKIKQRVAKKYYKKDHTHTSKAGARLHAHCVAQELRNIKSSLAQYLK